MLKVSQSALRLVPPILGKRASPTVAASAQMSSNTSSKGPFAPNPPIDCGSKSPKAEGKPDEDKGDSYKAGESYFSFNPYSFYDIENQMEPDRIPQPSSDPKMIDYCLDKLNPEDYQRGRKLLAVEYGDLEDYPGKPVYMVKEKPSRPVMRRSYGIQPKILDKETNYRKRMPL